MTVTRNLADDAPTLPRTAKALAVTAETHGWNVIIRAHGGYHGQVTIAAAHPDGTQYVRIWRRATWLESAAPVYRLDGGWMLTADMTRAQTPPSVARIRELIAQRPVTADGSAA